ncbi:MAG: tellurite methyltransferase [Gammaproteobacteria bacterium]|jgi:tellurite methyltransferase
MVRTIISFHQDAELDWMAQFPCGHRQHVRNYPPFNLRPQVLDTTTREERVGHTLACPLCERGEIPTKFVHFKRTPEFNEHTIPLGLRNAHATKTGIGAVIYVTQGALVYRDEVSEESALVHAPDTRTIAPTRRHSVSPEGPLSLFVEF